ncbi:MAG: LETM1 domain-containing protein, partial [Bacteroidota bacterium]
ILTIWADQIVTEEERVFIGTLTDELGLSRDELETSMVAIESFVLSNWGNIPFLQSKNTFDDIRSRFVDRMSKVMDKNKNQIGEEIRESKELMDLLVKSTKAELTEEEQIKVRAQLIDILKLLPTFVIIALPGSFLTLPLLLKILPKSALPTAFQEK